MAKAKDGMVSLEQSKAERERMETTPGDVEGPKYPYGTQLDLNHEHLQQMGMADGEMPKSGTKMQIMAHGHVKDGGDSMDEDGTTRRRMTIQLTHVKMKPHAENDSSEPEKPGEGVRKDLEAAFSKSAAKTNRKDTSGKSRRGSGADPGTDGE